MPEGRFHQKWSRPNVKFVAFQASKDAKNVIY